MKRSALAIFFVLTAALPLNAAVFNVRLLLDTDNNVGTGCTVSTAGGDVNGVEMVVTTQVTTTGTTGIVTALTRQTCSGGTLTAPSILDPTSWPVGVSATGDLLLETHIPRSVLPAPLGPIRFYLDITSGPDATAILTNRSGGPLIFYPTLRHHAAAPSPSMPTIHLDGVGTDWAHVALFSEGSGGSPALRLTGWYVAAGADDLFFRFDIQVNPNAPTAVADFYSLATAGGTLNVAAPGVLTNDFDPHGLPLTAILVAGPVNASSFTLNGNGSFTYVNNGSPIPVDGFLYKVTNGTLQSNVAPVVITIGTSGPAPNITSADHTTFTAGTLGTFTVTSTPTIPAPALTETGALPSGVTFVDNHNGTATLSGTPAANAGGVYTFTINATNAFGVAHQTFTLTVNQPPVITSASNTTFTVGSLGNFTVTTTGYPRPSIARSGALPSGVTFTDNGNGTGTLSGTPAPGTGGIYTLLFTATNTAGSSSQTFTLTVYQAPAFTSANNVHLQAGSPANFTITTSGFPPPGISKTGALPAGVTFTDNGNGTATIGGTPSNGSGGTYPLNLNAANPAGTASQAFTIVVCNSLVVNNPGTTTGTANTAFSQTFTQTGGVGTTTFSLNSGVLPAGLTLATNGTLSGTPTQTGTFPITVRATDSNGCTGVGPTYNLVIGCQTITVTNPATNTGTVNTAFSQIFTASNTIGAVTFSTSSTLPAGLALAANGTLSGTPTQTGTFPIVVKATDANGCFRNGATYNLTINCQTITVNNPATNSGTVNVAFSQTFTASNTVGALTFTTASTLPAGLTLATNGTLSGMPTQTGTFPIVVHVVDGNGCSANGAAYNLTINCQVITVNNPATNTGTVNVAFSQTFTASNAIGAVTFTTASTLPNGLSLSAGGVLSGTPTQSGTFPIVVHAVDANGCAGNGATYNLTINCQVITVNDPATNTGTVNVAFSQTFTASNTIGTVTFTTASTLPTGLSLSTGGVLSGTPTQTGTFPIVVHAVDANGCSGNGATYSLTISCQVITVTNPATNTGTVNTPFAQNFTASNTIGTVTFTTASTLPAGLSLSTAGVLSGTPTQTGSFPIVVHAVDANGCSGDGATYTLTIGCQVITVNNPANNTGAVNAAFSETFTAGNTVGTVTFTTASTLPTGLSLSTAGVLSGTPTQTGTFPIVVHAVDGNGCSGDGATYNLSIGCQTITVNNPVNNLGTVSAPFTETFTASNTVGTLTFTTASTLPNGLSLSTAGLLSGTPTQSGTFPIVVHVVDGNGCAGDGPTYNLIISCQTITVTNPATTSGPAGTPFSVTFTQSGGIGTVTFAETGSLPTGLTFHTATGVLDGTPTQGGSFPITVTATDQNGCQGTGPTYNLTITCPVITVTNPATNTGTAGVAFDQTFTQSGGQGTITWSETGALPSGITLNTLTGHLAGTTSTTGSFPITVTATDQNGCQGTGVTYTLTINCQTVTVTNPGANTGTVDAPFSQTFTASGILGTVTWSETGSLPAGITLDPNSGVLSGTPTVNGVFPITVKAQDTNGCFGTSSYTLTINCQTITVTKPVVTTGTVDAPFSQTFTQTGAHGTATFTTASTLPAGLSLSTAGVLSGTPTAPGTFPIVVTVTDSNGCTGNSTTYTLVIACQTITVTNPANATGTTNAAFSETFTQSGVGTHTPATFSINSGTLPTGFSLDPSTGVLSGTTQQHGTFPIVVRVTDANGCFGNGPTYNLVINCQTITVTNPGNNAGTVGVPFSEQFNQSGGLSGGTFSTASTLPTGLSLSSAGLLSGTPLQAGSFPIVVTFTDGNGCTGTGPTYTLIIACNVITVTNPATSTGTVDAAFSQTFTQSGGNGTITWSKTGAIPAGMTFHTATGVLDGTPGAPGSFPITVTATDQNGCTGTGPTYTLVISCQTITVNSPGVTTGTVDTAFSQNFTQSGVGTHTPATFTINSGSLPSGLTLSSAGVLSGTPGQPGSFPITVKVTDANGCTGISGTYTLVIACQTITVTNATTSTAVFNTALSPAANFTFTQSGVGTHTPATFTINSGTLPTGVSLSSAGVLSGTPTQTGTFPITVKVTDVNGCTGIGATYNLAITPNVQPDTYNNLVDNTQAFVTGGATGTPGTPAVQLSGSLTANDLPAGVSVTAGTFGTTQGGSVTIQSDGTFLYTPAVHAGAIASDTFTYTGTSNTGGTATPTTAIGSVTLNLANRVWYVRDNAAGGGDGRSQLPFNTLAAVQAVATANDIIFIHLGTTATTPLSGGLSLQNGAKLWGEGFGLTVNGNPLVAAGTQSRIKNTGGAAVTIDTSAATTGNRQNVEVKGLDLESTTTNGVNVTSNAANITSVTISGNNVRGAGTQGINLNQSSTGTFDATVSANTITSVGNGIQGRTNTAGTMAITASTNTISVSAGNGVDIRTVAGASALRIALDSEGVTASGTGILIDGSAAGTTTITSFLSNSINGNTGGTGISVTTAIFDATPGNPFNVVSGGSTVIGASGNGVGAAGMVLTTVKGDLSFTDLDIFTSNGVGLSATSAAAFNSGTGTGFQIVVGAGVATIDATGGPAVSLNTVTGNLPFVTIKSATSPTTGVALNSFLGTFSAGAGSTISGVTSAAGTSFQVGSSNATITYDGTINSTSGKGVDLTTNTGSTISFTGALTLSSGSNSAFNATGGGTVTSTATTSTLTTTTGTALNVANTTIGALGLKFQSVTSGTGASGPASGIILNNTGASGGLTVSGTGSAGTGGTIQKSSNIGVSVNSTMNVNLSFMNIQTSAHDGIAGTGVNGLSLTSCNITNNGTVSADKGIHIFDLSGAVTFTSDNVTGSFGDNVVIDATVSSTAVLTTLTVTNGAYSTSANGAGFLIQLKNNAAINTASFTGVTFNANATYYLDVVANDNSTIGNGAGAPGTGTVTVTGCTFTNGGGVGVSFAQGGGAGTSNMYIRFVSNTLTFTKSHVINVVSGATSGGGTQKVLISGNTIGTSNVVNSGSQLGSGIVVTQQGRTIGTVTILNNVIRELNNGGFGSRGIDVETLGPTGTGFAATPFDVKITGNDVNDQSGTAFPLYGIYLGADNQGSPTTLHAEVHGNTVTTPATGACDTQCGATIGMVWFEQVVAPSTGTLFNFGGNANVSAELAATNTGTAGKTCSPNIAVSLTATPVNTVP